MQLYTIGFTKKTAKQFFDSLKETNIEKLVDIRLRPDSQLAGFAKREDLRFFLERLNNCDYQYEPRLAPSDYLLKAYRENKDWKTYEAGFLQLLLERNIPQALDKTSFEIKRCCLLCSEAEPEQCHRRLVAEEMQKYWKNVQIVHI
jgi:uncharacterized protein (DUF488 family)